MYFSIYNRCYIVPTPPRAIETPLLRPETQLFGGLPRADAGPQTWSFSTCLVAAAASVVVVLAFGGGSEILPKRAASSS